MQINAKQIIKTSGLQRSSTRLYYAARKDESLRPGRGCCVGPQQLGNAQQISSTGHTQTRCLRSSCTNLFLLQDPDGAFKLLARN